MTSKAPTLHRVPGASFPVRHMGFRFAPTAFLFRNNVIIGNWLATMSAMFPDGEMFFVDSVRAMRQGATSDQLKKDISAFIGQEAVHAREHEALNRMLDACGHDATPVARNVAWLMDKLKRHLTPRQSLAVTAAAEHFTAILAKQLMSREDFHERLQDAEFQKIWLWHALEESEHKSIAFDLYREVGGGNAMRLAAYVPTSIYFALVMASGTVLLSARDRRCWNAGQITEALDILLGRNGFITTQMKEYLDYFRLDFHPTDHDTAALEARTRELIDLRD